MGWPMEVHVIGISRQSPWEVILTHYGKGRMYMSKKSIEFQLGSHLPQDSKFGVQDPCLAASPRVVALNVLHLYRLVPRE